MKIISESKLKDRLVFKGGTALHHHYLPQYRFSEDLDFTSVDQNVTEEDIVKVFSKYEFFNVKKTYVSPVTVKIENLQFSGVLGQANNLKIDISNVKNIAKKPKLRKYSNVWNLDFSVKVMDILEICAEKLSATSGRIRYRDFYDLFLIVNELNIDYKEAIDLLQQKDVEKKISRTAILENWKNAKKAKNDDISTIFLRKIVPDKEIASFLNSLSFKPVKKHTID